MNRWIEAIYYDVVGQEHKQRLTRKEKTMYSLYGASISFALGAVSMPLVFMYPSLWVGLISVAFLATGARKLQIYLQRRKEGDGVAP